VDEEAAGKKVELGGGHEDEKKRFEHSSEPAPKDTRKRFIIAFFLEREKRHW